MFSIGRTLTFEVAPPGVIQDALDERFSPERVVESLLGGLTDVDEESVKLVKEIGPESISEGDVSATLVVKLTNLIIRDAITAGASDIHIEPGRRFGVVRYRVDGVLRKPMGLPMTALNRIVSRVKVRAKLDIADRLRPQDGNARVQVKTRGYDLRVSTIPAGGAEKCVIRILDSSSSMSLDDLNIPGPELDGREVLDQIRGSVDTSALPVLIRTATGNDSLEAELLEAGADDYVEKSIDAARFIARVHAVTRRALLIRLRSRCNRFDGRFGSSRHQCAEYVPAGSNSTFGFITFPLIPIDTSVGAGQLYRLSCFWPGSRRQGPFRAAFSLNPSLSCSSLFGAASSRSQSSF